MMLNEIYTQSDYKDSAGVMFNADCLDIMVKMNDGAFAHYKSQLSAINVTDIEIQTERYSEENYK